MATRITISLDDDQAIALIRLAAAASTTTETLLLRLLDQAIFEEELPVLTVEEYLDGLSEELPRSGLDSSAVKKNS